MGDVRKYFGSWEVSNRGSRQRDGIVSQGWILTLQEFLVRALARGFPTYLRASLPPPCQHPLWDLPTHPAFAIEATVKVLSIIVYAPLALASRPSALAEVSSSA